RIPVQAELRDEAVHDPIDPRVVEEAARNQVVESVGPDRCPGAVHVHREVPRGRTEAYGELRGGRGGEALRAQQWVLRGARRFLGVLRAASDDEEGSREQAVQGRCT